MDTTTALWHVNPSESSLKLENAHREESAVVVDAKYSLISTGTERLVALGQVPESLHKSMVVPYMKGEFSFPVKYGYSLTGISTQGQKRVHLMHPHQTKCFVSQRDLHNIPDAIPLKRATLYSNLETAVNAVWDAQLESGSEVAVVGFGIVGALTAFAAQQLYNCHVTIHEPSRSRQEIAENLGMHLASENSPIPQVAFHTSATSAGLQTAIDTIGFEGRVIEMSWYGTRQVQVSLGGSFHSERKRVIASQVGSIPDHVPFENKFEARHQTVIQLLQKQQLDSFITDTIALDDAPAIFDEIRRGNLPGLGYCIEY